MTIAGWVIFGIAVVIIVIMTIVLTGYENKKRKAMAWAIAVVLIVAVFFGFRWYFTSTASGQRKMNDQKSNLQNGINRIVTVYTADGNIIAQYEGKIDLEADTSYVKFDLDGKRYIYYNCFVETIADIQ